MNQTIDFISKCFVILIIIVVFLYMITRTSVATDKCKKRYGENWHASGVYDIYCTNENGDMKGI